VVFLILLWIILFAVSLSLLGFLLGTFLQSGQVASISSLDWAGYSVTSDAANFQPVVTGVSASWTVPVIDVSGGDSFSAAWIGIGGQLDRTLIQAGTEHDSINGQAVYSVWYEMLPADSVTIDTINVSPGDKISASINLVNPNTNEWFIQIYDLTNGQVFDQNVAYNSSMLSAEWIVERPTVSNQLSTLANFGNITFTEAIATVNNHQAGISRFPYSQFIMGNRQNIHLTSVSRIGADGSSFAVTYLPIS
jgi:hypothetical protein